ncbi:FkbM family methyltransferase [Flavobacterium sp.]|uniref:FkbM family methyltransferase n=1 Tax=Flavobacterium sp. TaxID=239 RepID=UPI00286E9BA7|nr:FkbM family methyltransferase [Flavobacterium sp.]
MINLNGSLVEETKDTYITDFKGTFNKMVKLRKNPSSDFEVFNQVFSFKEYLPVVNAYIKNFNPKADATVNIIDAGSNIGLTSLFFSEYFQNATIISIEPEKENFKILEFNLNSAKNSKTIKINGALWSSNCKIKIVNDFRDRSSSSFRVEESDLTDAITAYSIPQLIANYNFEILDILKIDIEGSEKQLFTHPTSNLEFLNRTKCIAIEIHDEFDCREEICKILLDYGFVLFDEGELTIGINQKLK